MDARRRSRRTFLYNARMKRLALAALGGVVIPICYSILTIQIADYIENNSFKLLLLAPIEWPYWIYSLFLTPEPPRLSPFASPGVILSLYIGNFLLYSLLTYAILKWQNFPNN